MTIYYAVKNFNNEYIPVIPEHKPHTNSSAEKTIKEINAAIINIQKEIAALSDQSATKLNNKISCLNSFKERIISNFSAACYRNLFLRIRYLFDNVGLDNRIAACVEKLRMISENLCTNNPEGKSDKKYVTIIKLTNGPVKHQW